MSGARQMICDASIYGSIAAHCAGVYPSEGCGILSGSASGDCFLVRRAEAVRNISQNPAHHYRLAPQEYAAIERTILARGEQLAGFFHSHPDADAVPSAEDLEAAAGLFEFAGYRYIYAIQSVRKGAAVEAPRFWQLAADLKGFNELIVH